MKAFFFKTIRNLFVGNLCILVPLWMIVFGGTANQVRVQLRGKVTKPVSLAIGGITLVGKELEAKDGIRTWEFALRDGADWEKMEFILPDGLGPDSVCQVDLERLPGFVLRRNGGKLAKTTPDANHYAFPASGSSSLEFVSRGWALAFWGAELVLLGMAMVSAARRREESLRSLLLPALSGAFLLALLFQVILPLQSYLSNRSAFPFTASMLSGAIALRFCVFLLLGTACLLLLSRCFGRWTLAPAFSFAVCAYLESGVLAIGLPDLKGDWSFFDNLGRVTWDAAVWVGVFVLFLALHPLLKRRYGIVALCLSALFLSSLLDTRVESRADDSKLIVQSFSPLETVVRSTKYSTSGNVLVFVIDSLERGVAHRIVEDSEEGAALKEKFPGFTEYVDNVGGANSSLLGIANAFTGDYPESANLFDFFVSEYSGRSALKEYLENGFDIAMATEALGYGYCTSPIGAVASAGRFDCFLVPSTAWKSWTLAGINHFRWLPFGAKAAFAQGIDVSAPVGVFDPSEERVYPILRNAEVLRSGRKAFLFVHTHGVHIPVTIDRTGAPLPEPSITEQACVEMGIYIMRQLGALFDAYREKGIYDNSMIVVMADHGPHTTDNTAGPLPPNARPFLWIKPVGSRHAFRSSDLPSSHARLAGLLRAAAEKTLSQEEIENLIQSDERRYRWLRAGTGPEWQDLTIDRQGQVTSQSGMLSQPIEEMRPLELSRLYSLHKDEMGLNKLDIVFYNVTFWPSPLLEKHSDWLKFFFRAPDPGKRYALHIHFSCSEPGENTVLMFRQADSDAQWVDHTPQRAVEIVLHDLVPDADGKLEIEAKRREPCQVAFRLRQLMLEEEPEPDN